MTNDLTTTKSNLPAFVKKSTSSILDSMGGGLFESPPTISLRSSRFRFNKNGSVLNPNSELTHLDVVIVGTSEYVSRAYFDEAFDADKDIKPACVSKKGSMPDDTSVRPQSQSCASCKMNTKQPDPNRPGKSHTPCSFSKDMVVMIPGDNTGTLWKLKLSSMTIFNPKTSNDSHNHSWKSLLNNFIHMGVDPMHYVVRLSFDPTASVPVLLFSVMSVVGDGDSLYDEAFYNVVTHAMEQGEVDKLLNESAPAVEAAPAAPAVEAAPAAPAVEAAPAAPPVVKAVPVTPVVEETEPAVEAALNAATNAESAEVSELLSLFK